MNGGCPPGREGTRMVAYIRLPTGERTVKLFLSRVRGVTSLIVSNFFILLFLLIISITQARKVFFPGMIVIFDVFFCVESKSGRQIVVSRQDFEIL